MSNKNRDRFTAKEFAMAVIKEPVLCALILAGIGSVSVATYQQSQVSSTPHYNVK